MALSLSPILRRMTERARKLDASRLRVLPGGSPTPAPSYRLLTQVSAALSTSLDLDRTLKEILERMNALVAFDAATVILLDESRSEHQRLVEAIASQAAVAIDHARLFETERASRRRAEALLATSQAGSDAVTTPELLQRAVKQVAFAMRATAAAVILPDEAGEIIEAAFDASDPPAFGLESLRSKPTGALPLLAAIGDARRPLIVQRADRPPLLDDAFWSRSESQAVAAVPVRWQDRVIAMLIVGFADSERLTAAELELLEEIGRQVALGMERLRLQA